MIDGVGVARIDQRSLAIHLHGLIGLCHLQGEVDGLLLPEAGNHIAALLRRKALRFDPDRVCAGNELREVKAASFVCAGTALQS